MANIYISTITDMKNLFENTENGQSYTATLLNDLDFNNEDFYYKLEDFFTYNYGESGVITPREVVYDFNGKTLSNIYLNPGISLFKIKQPSTYTALSVNFTFKNGTFEIVSNSGRFISVNDSNMKMIYKLSFKNCIFNVKLVSYDRSFFYIFMNCLKNGVATDGRLSFINCVFNIEVSGQVNQTSIANFIDFGSLTGSSYHANFNLESCEFRIKDKSVSFAGSANGTYSQGSCANYSIINIKTQSNFTIQMNNNLFFLTNYTSNPSTDYTINSQTYTDKIYKLLYIYGDKVKANNNFFATLGTNSRPFNIVFYNYMSSSSSSFSLFYDKDKLGELGVYHYNSSNVLVPLTTQQCKDPDALEAAGYIFAHES